MLGRQRQDEIFRTIAADTNWKVCFVDTQEDADAACIWQVSKQIENCLVTTIPPSSDFAVILTGMPLAEYIDNSYIGYEIIIGKYDNLEYRFASFFHELGHTINHKDGYEIGFSKYEVEKRCWICGFKMMEFYGYRKSDLSKDTLRWCATKNFSYFFSELKWDIPWYSKVLRILNNIMWLCVKI